MQINIEKNKHKHGGTYLIPAPIFYYYPKEFNNLQYPQEFQNGISSSAFRGISSSDDYKTSTTTVSKYNYNSLVIFESKLIMMHSFKPSVPNDMLKIEFLENGDFSDKNFIQFSC